MFCQTRTGNPDTQAVLICLVCDVKHNSPASVTALTKFMGLSSIAQREHSPNGDFDLPLVYQLSEGLQEFTGNTSRKQCNAYTTLLHFLLRWLARYGDQGTSAFHRLQ